MKTLKIGWGWGLTIAIVLFMSFISSMVIISMQQKDIFLTESDYYEKQLAYQQVVEQKINAGKLKGLPKILLTQEPGLCIIDFSSTEQGQWLSGFIRFYRPSNPGLDQEFAICLDAGAQQMVRLDHFEKGKWICKISWQHEGRAFYCEIPVMF